MSLKCFTVRLALFGLRSATATDVIRDLEGELATRPHLGKPQIGQDSPANRVIIQVDVMGTDSSSAASQVQEEMLEAIAAVLWETEGLQILVDGVSPC